MSKILVFFCPQTSSEDSEKILDALWNRKNHESKHLHPEDVQIILYPSSFAEKVDDQLFFYFHKRKLSPKLIEDDNVGSGRMIELLSEVKTFTEFPEKFSKKDVLQCKRVGRVVKDTLNEYLSTCRNESITIVYAPMIIIIAYALTVIRDYWELLDHSLPKDEGGFIFEKNKNTITIYQHLQ
ncbi:MAG: hypothetical protein ACK4NC_02470 [Candidatus Gracilibacteria bacterium]